MAPPRHMPVPMRCTKSTGRMVARVGRPSMLQRLRRPKAARTKATRKDSRRELMDYDLLGVVAEEWKRHHDARPRLLRTRTTPTTRQMIAGQDVKKNKSPGPIGFGFGSGQSPIAASRMIARSGPQPKTTKARPTITHLFRRYSLILWVSLVPTPELSRAAKRLGLNELLDLSAVNRTTAARKAHRHCSHPSGGWGNVEESTSLLHKKSSASTWCDRRT